MVQCVQPEIFYSTSTLCKQGVSSTMHQACETQIRLANYAVLIKYESRLIYCSAYFTYFSGQCNYTMRKFVTCMPYWKQSSQNQALPNSLCGVVSGLVHPDISSLESVCLHHYSRHCRLMHWFVCDGRWHAFYIAGLEINYFFPPATVAGGFQNLVFLFY